MTFSINCKKQPINFQLGMPNIDLEKVTYYKYLGLYIDQYIYALEYSYFQLN